MNYGYFDDIRREYVITRPDTPLPWINYLGNEAFISLISNTAGGYAFYLDPRLRRITRYRYNNTPPDTGGRCIYLRDRDSKRFWSPTWQPTRVQVENYACRHGLGYTTIESQHSSISSWMRFFVPLGSNLEIWQLRLTNHDPAPRHISVFASVEFCLWDAWEDATNFQRNLNTGEVEVEDGVIYHKTEYRERRNHFAYFACHPKPAAYDTQRETFLGPYRGWHEPTAVEQGQLTNSLAHGWAPIGALQVDLNIQAGETRQVIFLLGYEENPVDKKFDPPDSQRINKHNVRKVIEHYTKDYKIEQAYKQLIGYWDELLGKLQVETPDFHTNRMVNTWNAYQCMITFNLSRSASYFESGIGRGMGFRDSNQDLLGFVHLVPERARQRILDLAATQLPDGGAYHQYQPLTKRGNNDIGSNFNDDPLWLVLAVCAYLKETGDFSILDEKAPFDNNPELAQPIYEHLLRSLSYIIERRGPHDLPLIGRADWNDCLNLNCFSTTPGQSFQTTTNQEGYVAESVFIAGLFVLAAKEMSDLARKLGRVREAVSFTTQAEEMETAVLKSGWDGEWFRRAYDAFGQPVGSVDNDEGQIYIEPQGMCVMAGIGLEDGKALQALDAVAERLGTEHGIMLHQPAYSRYYLHLGEISSYPPGYKENAGIFCHTNPWIMIAETRMGRGRRAHEYYLRINPSKREKISDVHRCEPYVYAQMIAGKDAPTHGEAKNSWLTGTAAWNYVAITQWILGIRPTLDGLLIDPVIPDEWKGFTAERRYRNVSYSIRVSRAAADDKPTMTVDGKKLSGKLIPLPEEGIENVLVEVEI
jgi:cellobiose phosphorylase